jgi:hypothetical protein
LVDSYKEFLSYEEIAAALGASESKISESDFDAFMQKLAERLETLKQEALARQEALNKGEAMNENSTSGGGDGGASKAEGGDKKPNTSGAGTVTTEEKPKASKGGGGGEKGDQKNTFEEVPVVTKPLTKEPENTTPVNLVGYVLVLPKGKKLEVRKEVLGALSVYYLENGTQKFYTIKNLRLYVKERNSVSWLIEIIKGQEIQLSKTQKHYFHPHHQIRVYDTNIYSR